MTKRATPEETLAAAAEQEDKPCPDDIRNTYRNIVLAARTGRLALSSFIPNGGTRVYYMLILVDDGGFAPVAVIPEGDPSIFMRLHDEWRDKLDSVINDPEYKGIIM